MHEEYNEMRCVTKKSELRLIISLEQHNPGYSSDNITH